MGKKQSWNNDKWIKEFRAARDRPKLPLLVKKDSTERIIQAMYKDNVVIGWSGGKDSIVLRHLCENCLENPVFEHVYMDIEFKCFTDWVKANKPQNCHELYSTSWGIDFFNAHPLALFPYTQAEKRFFITGRNKDLTYRWMEKNGFNKILTGKRIDDGNVCGRINEYGCKSTICNGIEALNILADWTVYDIFQYIHMFDLELPPMYYFPDGFVRGTDEWTHTKRRGTYKATFDFIYSFAPTDIEDVADKGMIMAQKYLSGELDI